MTKIHITRHLKIHMSNSQASVVSGNSPAIDTEILHTPYLSPFPQDVTAIKAIRIFKGSLAVQKNGENILVIEYCSIVQACFSRTLWHVI